MGSVPVGSKQEPKPKLRIPTDGHGGKFYQFGWVDELPQLFDYGQMPKTTYRGPSLEWSTLSEDLKKALYNLHDEQAVFEDVWKDAGSKLGPVAVKHSRRCHGELCPGRMSESVFGRLLDPTLRPKKKVAFKEVYCATAQGDEDDCEDHEPYSLAMMAQILCEKTEIEVQESFDEETDVGGEEETKKENEEAEGDLQSPQSNQEHLSERQDRDLKYPVED